jgi:predicted regulator of Ras-like GTPase activity (Roadblock/LC7/MglB family)
VICPRGSNIGLINLEASATAKKIGELFQLKRTRDSL